MFAHPAGHSQNKWLEIQGLPSLTIRWLGASTGTCLHRLSTSHTTFPATPRNRKCHFAHFSVKGTKAQGSPVPRLSPQSSWMVGKDLNLGLWLQSLLLPTTVLLPGTCLRVPLQHSADESCCRMLPDCTFRPFQSLHAGTTSLSVTHNTAVWQSLWVRLNLLLTMWSWAS